MFSINYTGDLRCACTHIQSGTVIETDAPTDNQGKGEKFSPTDLLCVSLATCMITTMAIKSGNPDLFKGTNLTVKKIMQATPRKISAIEITLDGRTANLSLEDQEKYMAIAENCPVALSLDPQINIKVEYKWF